MYNERREFPLHLCFNNVGRFSILALYDAAIPLTNKSFGRPGATLSRCTKVLNRDWYSHFDAAAKIAISCGRKKVGRDISLFD